MTHESSVTLGVEKVSPWCVTFVLLSLADAKDRVVKGESFPLKQEGGEDPQAQGEGAGKNLTGL